MLSTTTDATYFSIYVKVPALSCDANSSRVLVATTVRAAKAPPGASRVDLAPGPPGPGHRRSRELENMAVARVTEISATSPQSFEDAIRQGLAAAGALLAPEAGSVFASKRQATGRSNPPGRVLGARRVPMTLHVPLARPQWPPSSPLVLRPAPPHKRPRPIHTIPMRRWHRRRRLSHPEGWRGKAKARSPVSPA